MQQTNNKCDDDQTLENDISLVHNNNNAFNYATRKKIRMNE